MWGPDYEYITLVQGKDYIEIGHCTPLFSLFSQTVPVPGITCGEFHYSHLLQYPKVPVPEWESFASQRQAWEKPLEGAVQYKIKVWNKRWGCLSS